MYQDASYLQRLIATISTMKVNLTSNQYLFPRSISATTKKIQNLNSFNSCEIRWFSFSISILLGMSNIVFKAAFCMYVFFHKGGNLSCVIDCFLLLYDFFIWHGLAIFMWPMVFLWCTMVIYFDFNWNIQIGSSFKIAYTMCMLVW